MQKNKDSQTSQNFKKAFNPAKKKLTRFCIKQEYYMMALWEKN